MNIENNYFIDSEKYNCPFCHNKGIKYTVLAVLEFDETNSKKLKAVFVECSHCHKISLHLLHNDELTMDCRFMILANDGKEFSTYVSGQSNFYTFYKFNSYKNSENNKTSSICEDNNIILNIPTSFFTIDNRIPKKLRELVHEAEQCIQNNCYTGASACIRKAIYEFLLIEEASGDSYEDKIKSLKNKYAILDNDYIDILYNIQGIMCDKLHEASINKNFTSNETKAYIELLKTIYNQVYVIPDELKNQKANLSNIFGNLKSIRKNQT